jgi:hypothetical protein
MRVRSGAAAGAGTVLVLAGVATALPAAYLGVLTAAGFRPPPRLATHRTPRTRFAVLVPAHDEARTIGPALAAFDALDYPTELFGVHVVADNCSDDTGAVVREHGWTAHERVAPDEPGKGPALNWLHDRLVEQQVDFDAAVVVDADTSLDPGFLRAMDAALDAGAVAAQGYYSVRDPEASPATSFRYAALACRHHLRPLGRNRLGASCGLYGNGMVFTRDVLRGRRWTGHLVEDAEFQMELLLDGHRVTYVPDARLLAEMPHDVEGATSQNRRWERGRIEMAQRYVPRLVRRLRHGRGRRVALADATLDHLVPPVSVLVVAQVATAGAALAGTLFGSRLARRVLVTESVALATVAAHVLAGLAAVGAPSRHYRSLLSAPAIIVWKARLWLSVTHDDGEVAWTRTRRNVERGIGT